MELLNKIEIAKFCDENISLLDIKNFVLEHFSLKPTTPKLFNITHENNSKNLELDNDSVEVFPTVDYHENEFLEDDNEWLVNDVEPVNSSILDDKKIQFLDEQFNYNNFFHKESPEVYQKSIKGVLIESWERGGIVVLPFFLTENSKIGRAHV